MQYQNMLRATSSLLCTRFTPHVLTGTIARSTIVISAHDTHTSLYTVRVRFASTTAATVATTSSTLPIAPTTTTTLSEGTQSAVTALMDPFIQYPVFNHIASWFVALHDATGLSWSATIVLIAVILRMGVMLPLNLSALRSAGPMKTAGLLLAQYRNTASASRGTLISRDQRAALRILPNESENLCDDNIVANDTPKTQPTTSPRITGRSVQSTTTPRAHVPSLSLDPTPRKVTEIRKEPTSTTTMKTSQPSSKRTSTTIANNTAEDAVSAAASDADTILSEPMGRARRMEAEWAHRAQHLMGVSRVRFVIPAIATLPLWLLATLTLRFLTTADETALGPAALFALESLRDDSVAHVSDLTRADPTLIAPALYLAVLLATSAAQAGPTTSRTRGTRVMLAVRIALSICASVAAAQVPAAVALFWLASATCVGINIAMGRLLRIVQQRTGRGVVLTPETCDLVASARADVAAACRVPRVAPGNRRH